MAPAGPCVPQGLEAESPELQEGSSRSLGKAGCRLECGWRNRSCWGTSLWFSGMQRDRQGKALGEGRVTAVPKESNENSRTELCSGGGGGGSFPLGDVLSNSEILKRG